MVSKYLMCNMFESHLFAMLLVYCFYLLPFEKVESTEVNASNKHPSKSWKLPPTLDKLIRRSEI